MFSIFNRDKNLPEVPAWASFFNKSEYNKFVEAIGDYLKSRKITYSIGDGVLTSDEEVFGCEELGLLNVAQVCKQDKPRNYKNIVAEHFATLIRAQKFDIELKPLIHDFDKIKKYIEVRLYPIDYITQVGRELTLGKDFSNDIYAMLVLDLPDSIINIQPEQAEKWNKSTDELFDLGLENLKDKYPIDISQQKFGDFKIWFAQSDHFFTPNILFDLDNQPKLVGSYGSLIGVPHRHAVIIYPVENMEVAKAINILIPVIYGMNQEGPGSISNNLLWYKDNHFENLPYKFENKKVQFYPTEKFLEVLNSLNP